MFCKCNCSNTKEELKEEIIKELEEDLIKMVRGHITATFTGKESNMLLRMYGERKAQPNNKLNGLIKENIEYVVNNLANNKVSNIVSTQVSGESFIDGIVQRINNKQIGSK